MSSQITSELTPSLAPVLRRSAVWNVVSVVIPLLGLLAGPLLGIFVFDLLKHGSYHPMELALPALIGWLTFCAAGTAAAGIAMLRAERLWGVTAVGFLLSAAPLVVCAVISINQILWATNFLGFVTDFGPSGYGPSLIAEVRSSRIDDMLILVVILLPFVPAAGALIRRIVRGRLACKESRSIIRAS
jgi:hypothetical protein